MMRGLSRTDVLTGRQYLEWHEYSKLEPFGSIAANYHAALIAKMLADLQGATNEGKPFELADFLITLDEKAPQKKSKAKQTVEQQMEVAKMIAMAFNARGKNT